MALATLAKPALQRFPMGQLAMMPSVTDFVERGRLNPARYIRRHLAADWGDLSDFDWAANDRALRTGEGRLSSSYEIALDLTLLIVTESDRSATTLMLPSDD